MATRFPASRGLGAAALAGVLALGPGLAGCATTVEEQRVEDIESRLDALERRVSDVEERATAAENAAEEAARRAERAEARVREVAEQADEATRKAEMMFKKTVAK